ncbi:hypothetical protein FP2506_00395 [Fulvimarina pelagi HTCC2506]|uniref:Uncharacterized protein n=1 Tax=Fulvimarina pelagi HTCC2506 TaxID=314231 RepID=Q0FXQ6_9HYPH|nr:hypothetical protein [Fulvimarina pelagi]EAU39827.1 hypothetical protein FP2506_00395 [Fulvimarina pelagi HTCC2506]
MDGFLADYFAQEDRRTLLVAGAGFDPRSRAVASRLSAISTSVRALLFQENRPNPPQDHIDRAGVNTTALLAAVPEREIVPVEIFGSDGAVIGGRNIIAILNRQSFEDLTDIVVDVSALSVGMSFPIIRYFVERIGRGRGPANLHVFVAHDPRLDANIRSIPSDAPGYVHGFKGGSTLFAAAGAARLWLPQLASGRRGALGRLYDFIEPHDTCPILPFPASDPRLGDALAAEYMIELESTWSVDTRNIVYADESDPVDLYRTILRLDDLRQPVFNETGGSMLVLSPLGSKVMALGALMAALERDLPVAHLEPIGYEMEATVPAQIVEPNLIHIWLDGEAYPQLRPPLLTEGRTVP